MTEEVVSQQEIMMCPNCDRALTHGSAEFLGEGLMVVPVYCKVCEWNGTEEWVHDRTVLEDA